MTLEQAYARVREEVPRADVPRFCACGARLMWWEVECWACFNEFELALRELAEAVER